MSACLIRNSAPKGTVVVLLTGQSVQRSGGPNVVPVPAGSWWSLDDSSTEFEPLQDATGVKDLPLASEVVAAGYAVVVINLAIAGTSSAQWLPPSGSAYVTASASLVAALALLPALLAGSPPVWIHSHDQGEFEVALANPSGASQVNAWASNTLALFAQLEALCGQTMQHVVTWTKIPQPVNNWGPEVRALQTSIAASAAHIIDRDGLQYAADNIHLLNPDGQIAYGTLQGQRVVQLLGLAP